MSAFLSVITSARMEKAQCIKQKRHIQSEQMQIQRKLHDSNIMKMFHNIQFGKNLSEAELEQLDIKTTEPINGCEEYVEKSQEQLQKEAENKLEEMISNYQMQDAIDQSEIDALDLEITACDEQIKDAKQQAQEATREMYGSGK